jgi:hypothetical protein
MATAGCDCVYNERGFLQEECFECVQAAAEEERPLMEQVRKCRCGGEAHYQRGCACFICGRCDAHISTGGFQLARCYCGWTPHGGNGRVELEEMGENLEEDYS